MRFLTINALMEYGEKLYDRGDYDEASHVFNRILTFDSHQKKALGYLKEMGHEPSSTQKKTFKENDAMLQTADILDTKILKQAIEAKKKSIEKLKAQIMQMRANLNFSQTAEEVN